MHRLNNDTIMNILIMPTDQCNMNCAYCYHTSHYNYKSKEIMSLQTLTNVFEKSLPYYKKINYLWHGGEPMLAGYDFFRDGLSVQKELSQQYGCIVTNSIQTNITLAEGDLLKLLVAEGFQFGTSHDGVTNDITRGNTDRIESAIRRIKELGKPCGCILVVTSYNLHRLIECYEYFKERNIGFKFNHYINTTHDKRSQELSISIEEYLEEQQKLFDYWLVDEKCSIRVATFMVYIEYILFKRRMLGKYNSCLGRWLGIRYDGTIVQCNRYNISNYGNINDVDKISDAFDTSNFINTVSLAVKRRDICQKNCDTYDFCQGGCIVEASHELGIDKIHNFSCVETNIMFKYIKSKIDYLLEEYRRNYEIKINPFVKECFRQYCEKIQ